MRRLPVLLLLLALAAPASAADLALAPPPAEASTDGACVGRDVLRCLAMVYFCMYLVLVQGDVDRCLYVLE